MRGHHAGSRRLGSPRAAGGTVVLPKRGPRLPGRDGHRARRDRQQREQPRVATWTAAPSRTGQTAEGQSYAAWLARGTHTESGCWPARTAERWPPRGKRPRGAKPDAGPVRGAEERGFAGERARTAQAMVTGRCTRSSRHLMNRCRPMSLVRKNRARPRGRPPCAPPTPRATGVAYYPDRTGRKTPQEALLRPCHGCALVQGPRLLNRKPEKAGRWARGERGRGGRRVRCGL